VEIRYLFSKYLQLWFYCSLFRTPQLFLLSYMCWLVLLGLPGWCGFTLLGVVGSKLFSQTKLKSLRSSIGEEQLDHKVAGNSSQCMVTQC
jgi:hypothetical protein